MLYTKEINGQQVFSTCTTIQLPGGGWVSNPTAEQIAAAGWEEYIPPVVPPSPQTEPDLEAVMNAVKKMLASSTDDLSDEDALAVAALFPTWHEKIDSQVEAGERLWYDGKLYKVLQTHTSQSDWTPDTAVSLFVEVSIEEWPEWVQPISAETAYNEGAHVTFEGGHYISLINGNTWSPVEYPAGWEKQ